MFSYMLWATQFNLVSTTYSPGLRPLGVSGSFLDGPTVKGSYFQLVLGTPPAEKLGFAHYGITDLMALMGIMVLWISWRLWSLWYYGFHGPYGHYGIMDLMALMGMMVLWISWAL